MRQKKVNRNGDPVRHRVAVAPAGVPDPYKVYAAKCSFSIKGNRLVAAWRIYPPIIRGK